MIAKAKAVLQKPKWRTWLFISFVLLFYSTRTRPPSLINDIQILRDQRAFLAVGKTGVVVLDLKNPQEPQEITVYDTYGDAHGLDIVGDKIYVADGPGGLKVLSTKDIDTTGELSQTISVDTPDAALDVAVQGKKIFVAARKAGLVVYKETKQPNSPFEELATYDIGGKAQHLVLAEGRVYLSGDKGKLVILDVSDINKLSRIGEIELSDSIYAIAVDDQQKHIYVALGKNGLMILDISDLPAITILEKSVPDAVKEAYDIVLQGTYAYIASGKSGYYMLDVSDINNVAVLGQDKKPTNANTIEAYDDYVYVADARFGLMIFNSPIKFGFQKQDIVGTKGSYENVTVAGKYAYIAAGEAGLKVIDVSNPSTPVGVSFNDGTNDYATALDVFDEHLYVVYRSGGLKEYSLIDAPDQPAFTDVQVGLPGETNDIVVNNKTYMYAASGSAGFQVIDFSNFAAPDIYTVDTDGTAQGVFVKGKYAYVADGSAGIQIISISDPKMPYLVQSIETPGDAQAVFVTEQATELGDKQYAFIADGSRGLFIVDITDINHPVDVATYETDVFVTDVFVRGQTVYLSDRDKGLLILDISTIYKPLLVAYQDTPGQASGLYIQNNDLAFVADGSRGLRIIDVSTPEHLVEIGAFDVPKTAEVLVPYSNYGYLVDGNGGFWILDLTNPYLPLPMAFYQTPGQAKNVTVKDARAYIADGTGGLQIVDISNPHSPTLVGAYSDIQDARAVEVQGNIAYVLSTDQKLFLLNLESPDNIKKEGVYTTRSTPFDIAVWHNHAYIAEGNHGLEMVNIENPKSPSEATSLLDLDLHDSRAILISKDWEKMLVADGQYGVKVFDVKSPLFPKLVSSHPINGGVANALAIKGNYIFVAAENKGISVFNASNLINIDLAGEYIHPQSTDSPDEFSPSSISAVKTVSQESERLIIYVPEGTDGLQIFQADGKTTIQQYGFYETPGEAGFWDVVSSIPHIAAAIWFMNPEIVPHKVWERLLYIGFGAVTFFGLSYLWLILIAQFTLPVQNLRDGRRSFSRLRAFLWGRHGAAVFVKGGQITAHSGELERRGPGVARVDISSALVLERRVVFPPWHIRVRNKILRRQRSQETMCRARVAGPGVVFTEIDENIHGAADLRRQFRIRPGVLANTRDGLEIQSPVVIIFTLGESPDVVNVTYKGERKPENLRVVVLGEKPPDKEKPSSGKDTRPIVVVKDLSDELDPDDKEEIHRYVQQQKVSRYFSVAKELAIGLSIDDKQFISSMCTYVQRISALAERWNLAENKEVRRFNRFVRYLMQKTVNDYLHSLTRMMQLQQAAAGLQRSALQSQQDTTEIKKITSLQLHQIIDWQDEVSRLQKKVSQLQDEIREKQPLVSRHCTQIAKIQLCTEETKEKIDELQRNVAELISEIVKNQWEIAVTQGEIIEIQQHVVAALETMDARQNDEHSLRDAIQKQMRAMLAQQDARTAQQHAQAFSPAAALRNFIYQTGMLADRKRDLSLRIFYRYFRPRLAERYQSDLRILWDRYMFRPIAGILTSISDSDWIYPDRTVNWTALDALVYDAAGIYENFRITETKILAKLTDENNMAEKAARVENLDQFGWMTENLLRVDFPLQDMYSTLVALVIRDNRLSPILKNLDGCQHWDVFHLFRYFYIRRTIQRIHQDVSDLNSSLSRQLDRYVDLVETYSFVKPILDSLRGFRRAPNREERENNLDEIRRWATLLRNVADTEIFQRNRILRGIVRLVRNMDMGDDAQVYFFARQVSTLWERREAIERADIRRFIRTYQTRVDKINQAIRQIDAQISSRSNDEKIRDCLQLIRELQGIIEKSSFPGEMLNNEECSQNTDDIRPFRLNHRRVLSAIYSRALDHDFSLEDKHMPWTDLPIHVAAQTFRDMVLKEQYDYLFEPKDPTRYRLPVLQGNFIKKMRNQGILAFRFVDSIDGEPIKKEAEWNENNLVYYARRELTTPKVLRARGIKVIASSFPDLFPVSQKVSTRLLDTWKAPWDRQNADVRSRHQLQADRVVSQIRAQAQRDMAYTLARILRSSRSDEVLALRVFQALEAIADDEKTRPFLPRDTIYLLRSFQRWFLQGDDTSFGEIDDPDFPGDFLSE